MNASKNKLGSLDVSQNTKLSELYCEGCNLSQIDLKNNTLLKKLYCGDNLLKNIDLKANSKLIELNCKLNSISNLDLTHNKQLKELYCFSNQLSVLDLSMLKQLAILSCGDNKLTELSLENNPLLESLSCSYNNIVSIKLKNNTLLQGLACDHNQLTTLSVEGCKALNNIVIDHNKISLEGCRLFTESLAGRSAADESVVVYLNSEDSDSPEGNRYSSEDISRAKGKNWTFRNGENPIVTNLEQITTLMSVKLYPNPTRSVTTFATDVDKWYLYDNQGKLVSEGNTKTIDVTAFPVGIYFVKTIKGNNSTFVKLIVG